MTPTKKTINRAIKIGEYLNKRYNRGRSERKYFVQLKDTDHDHGIEAWERVEGEKVPGYKKIRSWSSAVKKAPIKNIKIKDAKPTQGLVSFHSSTFKKKLQSGQTETPIVVLKHKGEHHIIDGHHRYFENSLLKRKTIKAKVVENRVPSFKKFCLLNKPFYVNFKQRDIMQFQEFSKEISTFPANLNEEEVSDIGDEKKNIKHAKKHLYKLDSDKFKNIRKSLFQYADSTEVSRLINIPMLKISKKANAGKRVSEKKLDMNYYREWSKKFSDVDQKDVAKIKRHLKQAITNHVVQRPITVWSGISFTPEYNAARGEEIHLPAFTSTSLKRSVAGGFATYLDHSEHIYHKDTKEKIPFSEFHEARRNHNEQQMIQYYHLLKIHVPRYSHALYMRSVSPHPIEEEVLLHPGCRLHVHPEPGVDHKSHIVIWKSILTHDGIKEV